MGALDDLNAAVQDDLDDIDSPELERAYRRAFLSLRPLALERFARVASMEPVAAAITAGPPDGWQIPDPDELFTIAEAEAAITKQVGKTQAALVSQYGAHYSAILGSTWDVRNPLAQDVLHQLGTHITNVSETFRAEIMTTLNDAYERGLSIPHTASLMSERIDGLSTTRAKLIARTELSTVKNGSSLNAVKVGNAEAIAAGEQPIARFKEWLAAHDSRTRHDHAVADGQRVKVSDDFDVGGYQMQHPGDPRGPAKEVANCRCSLIYTDDPPAGYQQAHADQGVPEPEAPPPVELVDPDDAYIKMLQEAQARVQAGAPERAAQAKIAAEAAAKAAKAEATKAKRKANREAKKQAEIEAAAKASEHRLTPAQKQMALITPDSGSYIKSLSKPFDRYDAIAGGRQAYNALERVKPAYHPDFAIGGQQAIAAQTYKGSGYRIMNELLRYGDEGYSVKQIPDRERRVYEEANREFEPLTRDPASALDEDVVLFRGFSLPEHPTPGDVLEDKGFMSLSASIQTSEYFASSYSGRKPIMLRVHVREGTTGYSYPGAGNPGEEEFVLPPGSKVQIVRRVGVAGDRQYGGEFDVYDAVLLRADEVEAS